MQDNKIKLLRVTQLDAAYLNNELVKIFLTQAEECLHCLPPTIAVKYSKEVNLLVKLLLSYSSLFNYDCTFGQKLLLVKYENLTFSKKILYLASNLSDYILEKIEEAGRNHPAYTFLKNVELLITSLSLINLCLFLRSGKYPLLIERVLGLRQVYTKDFVRRHFSSEYLTRELLWSGFIEVLVYILPILNYQKLKRVARNFNPFYKSGAEIEIFNRDFTTNTKCASCNESPVLPHHMGCSHIFCYVCLKANLAADPQYDCPICGHKNLKETCEALT